jgi:hypothetical protein
MIRLHTVTALASLGLSLLASLAGPASDDVIPDPEVAYALEHEPGGFLLNAHEAYWPEHQMTMTSSYALEQAVGTCATGNICAYSAINLGGAQLSWSSCMSHSTAALPSVQSIANARSTGTLHARNGGTVVASASAGQQANVWSTVTDVQCRP